MPQATSASKSWHRPCVGIAPDPVIWSVAGGGEEFAVILAGTDLAGAEHVAGELVDVVRGLSISRTISGKGACVTISAGVASAVPDNDNSSAKALVEKADSALYAAKNAGRDRVRCAA